MLGKLILLFILLPLADLWLLLVLSNYTGWEVSVLPVSYTHLTLPTTPYV